MKVRKKVVILELQNKLFCHQINYKTIFKVYTNIYNRYQVEEIMLKQTINDAKPKTHNTEEKYLRQNVKRTSLPPIFELKPILANYIGQSSDLLQ